MARASQTREESVEAYRTDLRERPRQSDHHVILLVSVTNIVCRREVAANAVQSLKAIHNVRCIHKTESELWNASEDSPTARAVENNKIVILKITNLSINSVGMRRQKLRFCR